MKTMLAHVRQPLLLVVVLLIASFLRLYHLGQGSLWYDEVVTIRLARTESPHSLMRLLVQIDATRAPLHPLVLQGWLKLFGPSDYAARVFSALCGIITIGLVYWIGVQAIDTSTGLLAAWLCALSPLLVYYSREARMYMWLVLITCCAWGLLFSYARSPQRWRLILYSLSLIAIFYSHPLGMLMIGTIALVSAIFRQAFQISWSAWLSIHSVVTLAVTPWVEHYLDHNPELTSGLLPIRYLLGVPIGFIGGNFQVLVLCVLLIVYGLCQVKRQADGWIRVAMEPHAQSISLVIWLIVPPVLLYGYSRVFHPIFGPSRYTLFVGPPYLILVARGMLKLPRSIGIASVAASAILSGYMLLDDVYRSGRDADWRSAAAYLDQREPRAMVAVVTGSLFGNTELETARYYFGVNRAVVPWVDPPPTSMNQLGPIWVSIGLEDNHPLENLPATLATGKVVKEVVDFSRLRLMKVDLDPALGPGK